MKYTKRNFILAYVLLVLLPLLGLTQVLKRGHNLTAPISVGGHWKMQIDPESLAGLPCGSLLLASQKTDFTISQSGKTFTLSFASPPISTSGTIEGTSVKADIPPSSWEAKQAGCSGGHGLSLTGIVNSKAAPPSLRGVLSVNECQACARVELHAVRED